MSKFDNGTFLAAALGLMQSGVVRNPREMSRASFDADLAALAKTANGRLSLELVSATLLPEQAKMKTSTSTGQQYASGEYSVKYMVTFKVGEKTFTQKMHACDVLAFEDAGKSELPFTVTAGQIDRTGQDPLQFLQFRCENRLSEGDTLRVLESMAAKVPA